MIHVEIKSKEFGRIATQNAKNVILQKIREEERSVIYNQYYEKERMLSPAWYSVMSAKHQHQPG